jgi:transcription antitermination factor NusG
MPQWFALRVKSRFEKSVAEAVRRKGFEEFLPVYKSRHKWSDRAKSVESPLFPGYVFCRLEAEQRFRLLTIPGVMHVVSIGKTPVPVDEAEISAVQSAIRFRMPLEPWPFVEAGKRVRYGSGQEGVEGFLVPGEDEQRIVVNLSALRKAVAIAIEPGWVEAKSSGAAGS